MQVKNKTAESADSVQNNVVSSIQKSEDSINDQQANNSKSLKNAKQSHNHDNNNSNNHRRYIKQTNNKYSINQNNFYENAVFSYMNNLNDHFYFMDQSNLIYFPQQDGSFSINKIGKIKKNSKGNLQATCIDENQNHFMDGYDNNIEFKKERPSSTSKTNIYIRGLNENTTDKDLYDMCQKFGDIKSTKAIIEKQTNKCKGYGFVDYKNPEDALNALNEMKKEQKDVQLAKQREQDPTNLYFANLPADIDEKCLTELLQKKFNATVNSTRIMRERTGNSKGVGFARVDFKDTCEKIIKELNGNSFPDHEDTNKVLLVKLADSGTSFKSNKIYKMSQSNKFPSENVPNGFHSTMPRFIEPILNNGYQMQMYDNSQIMHNVPYMHLVHHQLQPPSQHPNMPNQPPFIAHSNMTASSQMANPHTPQSNMNAVQNNIYYTNPSVLPSAHHSMLQTMHMPSMPYVILQTQDSSTHRQSHQVGHYQVSATYDKNNIINQQSNQYNSAVNNKINSPPNTAPSSSNSNSSNNNLVNSNQHSASQSNSSQSQYKNSTHMNTMGGQQYQYQL